MKNAFTPVLLFLLVSSGSFAAVADSVLLERSTLGLPSALPQNSSVVFVYASGKVYGHSCQSIAKQTFPVTYSKICKPGAVFKTLSPAEITKIKALIEETKSGKVVGPPPVNCTAIPVESITYWVTDSCGVSHSHRYIYTGTQPCGGTFKNDSAATGDLRQLLDELREEYSQS
jgi:hypothetical protein